jgi:rod shape-determining protein MreC
MRRRKRGGGRGVAGLIALCLAALVLFTVYVREGDSGPLHTVQLGAYEILRPAREAVGTVMSPLAGAGDRVSGAFAAGEEEALKSELRDYREQAAGAAALKDENERLRRMLDGGDSGYEYGPLARVISPVGEQFTERMVIDIGSEQGVESGQPVVVGERTLVGRTTGRITAETAEVMLVGDPNFAAGVRIVPPREAQTGKDGTVAEAPLGTGLLRNHWRDSLIVEYVDREARAKKGDFVVTSGRAGERKLLFPPGLLVGTVSSVGSEDIDQYQEVRVKPVERPQDVHQVRVVLDW